MRHFARRFVTPLLELARCAGDAVMNVYAQDFAVYEKQDRSPLTEADLASHRLITETLATLTPDVPVLSEESAALPWEERRTWRRYWLVDPLDGTKEFVKRNGEFTVNIALIEDHAPVLGVVYAPVLKTLYWGVQGEGAWQDDGGVQRLEPLPFPADTGPWKIVGSRSHGSAAFDAFVSQFERVEAVPVGSSLKFCLVAAGEAHLFPRFGPTSEWDTAAGQCVVEAAGGAVYNLESGEPLRYNTKTSLLNPHFLVTAEPSTRFLKASKGR